MNDYSAIADQITTSSPALPPDKESIEAAMWTIQETLFPENGSDVFSTLKNLQRIYAETFNLINDGIITLSRNTRTRSTLSAFSIIETVIGSLPRIQQQVRGDIDAALRGDPAAHDAAEVIRYYPGFTAMFYYRIAHLLSNLGVPYIPRGISESAHTKTGIDIHPGATIGERLFIDHGTGVVIGETATIGNDVKIYQGVTLGALSLPKDNSNKSVVVGKRHPTIEDRATIYANATILGGDTIIGHDAVVGANAWIRESVLPHTKVGIDPSAIMKRPSAPST